MRDLSPDQPDPPELWPRFDSGARCSRLVIAALTTTLLMEGQAHAQFGGPPAAPFITPTYPPYSQSTPIYPQQFGQRCYTQYGICLSQYPVPTGTQCTCTLSNGVPVQGQIGQ